jgi:hypothetical protein
MEPSVPLSNPELELLKGNKQSGYNYVERRYDEWTENYTLYRNRVIYNRLTQRQTVNLPLMKMGLRSLMKDVDDLPVIELQNLDNDTEAEVFQNEYWKVCGDENHNNFEIKDIIDKKQVFHFGRTFDQWQIVNGWIKQTIINPKNILVSRYTETDNIHTSRFLIHTHIFVPLATLEDNPDYDKDEIKKLKTYYATQQGLIKAKDNFDMYTRSTQDMRDLGVEDVDQPILGETYIELSLHFIWKKREGGTEEEIHLYVEADDMVILMKKPLEEVIGVTKDRFFKTHYPYCTWGDDMDNSDFWTDGIADTLRNPNKVLNTWYSQMVENRTLRNYGMNYYDAASAADKGFAPQVWEPTAGGWYGLPGKPSEFLQRVDIPDLSESIDEMDKVIEWAQKASGATDTQQGVQTQKQVTLGEVQLALGEAKERIKGMSKFYTNVWKQRAFMFLKLIEAGGDKLDAVKIYKKGRNTDDLYMREIAPSDFTTESGYQVKVWSQDERNAENENKIQRINATKSNMPDNPVVDKVFKRRLLEFGDFAPDEIKDAMDYEEQKQQALLQQQQMMEQGMGQPQLGAPQQGMPNPQAPMYPPPPPPEPAKTKKKSSNGAVVSKLKDIKSRLSMAAG